MLGSEYKFFLFIAWLIVTIAYTDTIRSGRSHKREPAAGWQAHRKNARRFLFSLIVFVPLVDGGVRLSGNATYDTLFYVHLSFALSLLAAVLFLISRLGNGTKWRYHGRLGLSTMPLYIGMSVTGLFLLWRL